VTERLHVRLLAVALPGRLGQLRLSCKPNTCLWAGVTAGRIYLCRVAGNTV